MPHALTARARAEIELQLGLGTDYKQIARSFNISLPQVYKMRSNLKYFGSVWVDPKQFVKPGRPKILTREHEEAVVDFLLENKQAYLDEVVTFLEEEFDVSPSLNTVSRLLRRLKITAKKVSRIAQAQDQELRAYHIGWMAQYPHDYFVFVDESASNERTADRRRGWSPAGTPCRVKSDMKKSKRWSILPAITADDGYIACQIYHGSFNAERFNEFIIGQVLPQMNPFPAPRSVLIMDNCSTHKTQALKRVCDDRGIELVFLPPYSPDLNPIESSFASLKRWIRRNRELAVYFGNDFEGFLSLAVLQFMEGKTAHGWFRASGIYISENLYRKDMDTEVEHEELTDWSDSEVEDISDIEV